MDCLFVNDGIIPFMEHYNTHGDEPFHPSMSQGSYTVEA